MKLLIVDDEKLTREGIISSIDWDALGVTQLYQADDGIHALELSRSVRPDIVLSDVRMPRMDGIEMASRLRDLFPHINIIFMSGYSDKEYLKAAIKLKAISYVEKPIDPEEIREAVLESMENKLHLEETKDTYKEHRRFAVSSLASSLIYQSHRSEEEYEAEFDRYSLHISPTSCFTTMLFSFAKPLSDIPGQALLNFYGQIHDLLERYAYEEIHGIKQERFLLFHFWGMRPPMELLKIFASMAKQMACALTGDFFLVIGKSVIGAGQIFDSYNSAVILLQSSFYYPYGSTFICGQSDLKISTISALPVSMDEFRELLNARNTEALEAARSIYENMISSKNVLPNQVKDIYYQMISSIQEACHTLQLPPGEQSFQGNYLELVFRCETIFELNKMLLSELEAFFRQSDLSRDESSPVTSIKSFIASHYSDETLSIKDISEHVFLSTSYMCTLFKNETGQTLNQYLTFYRMGKAKKLLADPRYKVSDISSKVGYSDGNYFGKTFKKIVGLSPTEYREQVNGI